MLSELEISMSLKFCFYGSTDWNSAEDRTIWNHPKYVQIVMIMIIIKKLILWRWHFLDLELMLQLDKRLQFNLNSGSLLYHILYFMSYHTALWYSFVFVVISVENNGSVARLLVVAMTSLLCCCHVQLISSVMLCLLYTALYFIIYYNIHMMSN